MVGDKGRDDGSLEAAVEHPSGDLLGGPRAHLGLARRVPGPLGRATAIAVGRGGERGAEEGAIGGLLFVADRLETVVDVLGGLSRRGARRLLLRLLLYRCGTTWRQLCTEWLESELRRCGTTDTDRVDAGRQRKRRPTFAVRVVGVGIEEEGGVCGTLGGQADGLGSRGALVGEREAEFEVVLARALEREDRPRDGLWYAYHGGRRRL